MIVNIAAQLPQMAARQPNVVAIREASGRTTTYRELDAESDAIAHGLASAGIGRGTRTVLMVPPSIELFALAFGMAKAGVVPVVVDPGMDRRHLTTCLAEAQPEAFIGVPRAHAARLALGWARGTIRKLVTVGGFGLFGGMTLEQVRGIGRAERGAALAPTQPDEIAAILFTSGSTGRPKGAVYTHGNFAAQVEALRRASGIEPGEVDLPTFAPFALFDPALGMTTVLPRMDFARPGSADPAHLAATIAAHRVTNLFCSPALLAVLVRWGLPRGLKLTTLRRIVTAGAPVSPSLLEQARRLLPEGAQVFTPYGATEALPVAIAGSDELLPLVGQRETGAGLCVGRPVAELDVAIIPIGDEVISRWEEGRRLPPGEVGEIVVRGPMVTARYWRREADTALAKIADPATDTVWHRMGDLGYLDGDGRLWFCGRKSQRVSPASGPTMFTIPCEAVFNAHPGVRRTALVGARRQGKVVPVLCVEREPSATGADRSQLTEELLALGAQHSHTVPVRTILFHPGFPVDTRHNAKIGREALASWAEARLR